jgi:hypothetical protein
VQLHAAGCLYVVRWNHFLRYDCDCHKWHRLLVDQTKDVLLMPSVRLQRMIAEQLSQPVDPEDIASREQAKAEHGKQGVQDAFSKYIATPALQSWHIVTTWLSRAWAWFVNWTVLLGEFVKRLFFSGK